MASLFTKIMTGEIKGSIVHQDRHCAAILDIQPQAPKHILIIPRKEIRSLAHLSAEDQNLMGHLLMTAAQVAEAQGLKESGYRLVINTGQDAGQTVDHLHIHLLGGKAMGWPPL